MIHKTKAFLVVVFLLLTLGERVFSQFQRVIQIKAGTNITLSPSNGFGVVTVTAAGSGISGSGSSGQLAFWIGTNSLSGDNALFWDNTIKTLKIGTIGSLIPLGSGNFQFVSQSSIASSNVNKVIYLFNNGTVLKLDAFDYGLSTPLNIQIGGNGGDVFFHGNGVGIWKFNGNIGLATTLPTNILSLGGQSNQTFWMERQLTAATPGNSLTVQASGAVIGGTNLAGGALNLSGGTSTGTGTSVVNLQTASAGATGSVDRIPTTKIQIDGQGHVISTGGVAPTITAGCGTSPSISGTDVLGTITVGTGGVATSCTVTFGVTWSSIPKCFSNHEGAVLATRAVATTTTVVIDALTALTAGGKLDYWCVSN